MTENYTRKQMGDACEMLIAAELTLHGMPAFTVPHFWPDYDVIAQPRDERPQQRISVKSRTFKRGPAFVAYPDRHEFVASNRAVARRRRDGAAILHRSAERCR